MDFDHLERELLRCRNLLDEERYDEAWRLARRLREKAPEDPEVLAVYCDAALSAGHPAEGLKTARAWLRLVPDDIEAREWLARAQWDLHLTEACRATCRLILAEEPENYVALDYALATVLELADFPECGDLIDLAARCQSADRHIRYQTAVARLMRGGEEEWALAAFEAFLAEDPDEPATYVHLMRIHGIAGRHDRATEVYEAARARNLRHEDLEFNMGLALLDRGEPRAALYHFVAAVRAAPEVPDAHLHVGQILRDEGHPRLALAVLARELRLDDTNPAAHAEIAWCQEDLGNLPEAVRMMRGAVERSSDWPIAHHSLAELLLKADPGSPEAGTVALRAVALDENHAGGWQVLGRLAAARGEFDEAERLLRKAVAAKDRTAEDEGWLGLFLADRERREEARPFLERAIRTYPQWDPAAQALERIRGRPLPRRYEIRLAGRGSAGPWYRVVHVVASDEKYARESAISSEPAETRGREEVREVHVLGFEVDEKPGVVWDSGPTPRRYPHPPAADS